MEERELVEVSRALTTIRQAVAAHPGDFRRLPVLAWERIHSRFNHAATVAVAGRKSFPDLDDADVYPMVFTTAGASGGALHYLDGSGTPVRWARVSDVETGLCFGHVGGMAAYQGKSFEELHLEDLAAGRHCRALAPNVAGTPDVQVTAAGILLDLALGAIGGSGFVWVDRWRQMFTRLGTLRSFLSSRPDHFAVASSGTMFSARILGSDFVLNRDPRIELFRLELSLGDDNGFLKEALALVVEALPGTSSRALDEVGARRWTGCRPVRTDNLGLVDVEPLVEPGRMPRASGREFEFLLGPLGSMDANDLVAGRRLVVGIRRRCREAFPSTDVSSLDRLVRSLSDALVKRKN